MSSVVDSCLLFSIFRAAISSFCSLNCHLFSFFSFSTHVTGFTRNRGGGFISTGHEIPSFTAKVEKSGEKWQGGDILKRYTETFISESTMTAKTLKPMHFPLPLFFSRWLRWRFGKTTHYRHHVCKKIQRCFFTPYIVNVVKGYSVDIPVDINIYCT